MPSLQKARKSAQAVVCGNNLKQIGVVLISYDQTYGAFPYTADWSQPDSVPCANTKLKCYTELIEKDFNGGTKVFSCPGDKGIIWPVKPKSIHPRIKYAVSYGIQYNITANPAASPTTGPGVPVKAIKCPSSGSTVLAGDSSYPEGWWLHMAFPEFPEWWTLDLPDLGIWGWIAPSDNLTRHGGRTNLLYVDGHITPEHWRKLIKENPDSKRFDQRWWPRYKY